MGRALLMLLVAVGFVAVVVVVATMGGGDVAIESSAQSAAVLEGVVATPESFNETGTLVFYPNNVGPVPYLFYQDQNGHTIAKALTFSNMMPANFSSWTGARVSVTGTLTNEHVAVSHIAYISAP